MTAFARCSLLLLLLLPAATSAQTTCTTGDPEIRKRIERVVDGLLATTAAEGRFAEPAKLADRMAYRQTPGVSIAVVNGFELEWACGFGVREKGKPEPVTPATLFQAGSISKPIFALAAMRLVEEGKLGLDDDVNQRLTSWKIPATGGWQPRVTLRQILSHSAGLTVHGFPGYGVEERIPTVVEVLDGRPPANTARVEVNILPGVQFRYAGGGTTVAQQLVTDVLARPFPRILRELVLDPLGMKDSTYEQPLPPDRAAAAAAAHPWKSRPLAGRWHIYPLAGFLSGDAGDGHDRAVRHGFPGRRVRDPVEARAQGRAPGREPAAHRGQPAAAGPGPGVRDQLPAGAAQQQGDLRKGRSGSRQAAHPGAGRTPDRGRTAAVGFSNRASF